MVLHVSLDNGDLPSGEVLTMSPRGSGISGWISASGRLILHQLAS
jgi:hypothetical protein